MNDKIKNLILAAQKEAAKETQANSFAYESLVYEKFAELIVKECAQVCLAQRNPSNLNYKPSEKFAEAVKQHFGVK
jgi:hypothetical protein